MSPNLHTHKQHTCTRYRYSKQDHKIKCILALLTLKTEINGTNQNQQNLRVIRRVIADTIAKAAYKRSMYTEQM